ncbi:cAMP-dependent protein kinase catalytic subunit [Xanthoria parietina]
MECMRHRFVEGMVLDGRFESISPLNNGSFGMVFLAKDRKTGESVAIKCLARNSISDKGTASVPEDHTVELACHDRLGRHPNIVSLVHSFETTAHIYLVLEFCSMGDLYEAINVGRGPLETENVRELMLQLVNAVDFMHSKGIYHRDIKPENIFLAQDGSMKLGDFGLATTDAWSYESSVGSDRYMAPEQYDATESGYSPAKADIWAIGICLLNVLFSKNPFVTPTESDKLFADYARDNQSLFDVFANMSQDTFEVLSHCLAIDPAKRSLSALREKLERVVTFTTDEETLDDFCNEERDVVPPTANREPLRTPSLQSPQTDTGSAFPWAKALHTSPQRPGRQLSAIPDTESYTESLFPASERDRQSWYSAAMNSSLTSGFDSVLEASVKSMVLHQPAPRHPPLSDPVQISGSLPAPSKPLPTLSSVFGRKDNSISKSWTDMWDEDEEDEFVEAEEALKKRREYNSRTWSQESNNADAAVHRSALSEIKSSRINSTMHGLEGKRSPQGIDDHEDFVFEHGASPQSVSRYSPPTKRTISPPARRGIMDKWAALGNRRRAYHDGDGDMTPQPGKKRSSVTGGSWRDGLGFKAFSSNMGFGGSGSGRDRKDSFNSKVRNWRRDGQQQQQPSHLHHLKEREAAETSTDSEWVGGWNDLHL